MKSRTITRGVSGAAAALYAAAAFNLAITTPAAATDLEIAAEQPVAVDTVDAASTAAKAPPSSHDGKAVYIVRLDDPSVARYKGGIEGFAATNPAALGATRLDVNSEASRAYEGLLRTKQDALIEHCETAFGHSINVPFKYQHVLNGVAMELTADEAAAVASLDGVASVERERMEMPMTDAGPKWIRAHDVWAGRPSGAPSSKGEGAVIAILDTGFNSDHPSYAAVGSDGYAHTNPMGSGNYVPGSYCDTTDPSFCNDKVIGAWSFVPADPAYPTPEDTDGHGSHTAGTAGGNFVDDAAIAAPTTSFVRDVSGVAPHANLVIYDVCVVTCPNSALIGAINQVVVDAGNIPGGIHALNYSISGGNDPYNSNTELAFLDATAAGVFVSTSAGNAGPGPGTTGHNSPWVSATAAATHHRVITNDVINMTSDAASLPDIFGQGLTSGYGPAPIINSADLEGAFPGSTLCGLGDLGDFNPPWPPGTFNGEIVACTRGTFGRVEKGANVLSAGAGGYILMDNGGGLRADPHVLPGVHISLADRAVLEAWLAANPNPMGTISGWGVSLDRDNGDIVAGFSSRGPNSSIDILKPDTAAPGVSIMAANYSDGSPAPEFQFLQGTSMASPHNAGLGALLSQTHPDWSPYEIKSAIMMTADNRDTVKEDGATPADPFDVGAGRINARQANLAALTLDETPANFLAADPGAGGDPKTLNLASMQDSACLGSCSWTRTVENVTDDTMTWKVKRGNTTGGWNLPAGMKVDFSDTEFTLDPGEKKSITVNVDTALAAPGWNFAEARLRNKHQLPNLHMTIAANNVTSTDPAVLSKTVDLAEASKGDIVTYNIDLTNGRLAGTIDLTDMIPDAVTAIPGTETESVSGGATTSPFTISGNTATWSGTLDVGGLQIVEDGAPLGFFSIAGLVAPFGCPSNCDDGAFIVNVPSFQYNGASYSQVIWSVNGTLEAGSASGLATSFLNQNLPDPTTPNNIIAPFWTDLNMGSDGDGAEWYVGVFNLGPDQFTIYEWNNIPRFGSTTDRFTFQIWVRNGANGGIWFTYGQLGSLGDGTVGAENADGSDGDSRFFDGAGTPPALGTDLKIEATQGGSAQFSFQAEVGRCRDGDAIVNKVTAATDSDSESAIAVTECRKQPHYPD